MGRTVLGPSAGRPGTARVAPFRKVVPSPAKKTFEACMDLQLKDKLALVTGSTAGIGLAIAASLAAEGTRVIVNGRDEKRVNGALEEIRRAQPQANLAGLAADLAQPPGAAETIRRFPEVDILVNNLGIFESRSRSPRSATRTGCTSSRSTSSAACGSAGFYLPADSSRRTGAESRSSPASPGLNIPAEMIHYGVTKTAQDPALGPWPGRDDRRDERDRQLGAPRPDPLRGRGEVRSGHGGRPRPATRRGRGEGVLPLGAPLLAAEAVCHAGGSGGDGRLMCSPRASATNGRPLRVDGGVVRSIV